MEKFDVETECYFETRNQKQILNRETWEGLSFQEVRDLCAPKPTVSGNALVTYIKKLTRSNGKWEKLKNNSLPYD